MASEIGCWSMQAESPSELDQLWIDAFESLHNQVSMVRFNITLLLLREAIECCKYQCVIGSLVMCRDTIESALFVLQNWRRHQERIPLEWGGQRSLPSLIAWGKGNDVLTEQGANTAQQIKEMGDMGAHFEQRIAKEMFERIRRGESYRTDVGANEANQAIHDTVNLLKAMAQCEYVKRHLND